MILHNEIRLNLLVTSKRNLQSFLHEDLVTNLNNFIIFVIAIYEINLLINQDIFFIKHSCILIKKNLYSEILGSGLNPRGVLEFSALYFLAKENSTAK